MPVEIEGAVNRLTAATLALATTVHWNLDGERSEGEARELTEDRFEDHLDYIMER
jgi:hypothetical protein